MIAFLTSARRVYVGLAPSVNCYAGKNLGTRVWDGKRCIRLPPKARSAIPKSSRKRGMKHPCSNAGPAPGGPAASPRHAQACIMRPNPHALSCPRGTRNQGNGPTRTARSSGHVTRCPRISLSPPAERDPQLSRNRGLQNVTPCHTTQYSAETSKALEPRVGRRRQSGGRVRMWRRPAEPLAMSIN